MLIGNFHARFPEDMPSVLGLFSIFNVANFTSSSDSEEFKVYGDESICIKKKKNHFRGGENTTRNQWGDFRFEMILIRG